VSKNSRSYRSVDDDEERPFSESSRNARKNAGISVAPRLNACGADVAQEIDMSFATLVDRVRTDFTEMPEMELTLPQAVRLWTLGMDDCRYVIDSLVDAGFLAWTAKRTIVRRGRDPLGRNDLQPAHISVLAAKRYDKSVWNDQQQQQQQ
jgi:hypothetical protein